MTPEQIMKLDIQDNKNIIEKIKKDQAIDLSFGGAIAAIIGIPVAVALPLVCTMTPAIIATTAISGIVAIIGLLCIGFAAYHGFKEIPSNDMNEPRSTGGVPEYNL